MNDDVVVAEHLSCTLGGKAILKGISLSAKAGEYVSIVGPNGSGKTTFLKCLVRIVRSWHGGITVCGRDLNGYSQKELARLISYVPQGDGHSSPFTVREFVAMARYPYLSPFSSPGERDDEAVLSALRITRTDHLADRLTNSLSGGERQKVFIAAALAQESEVMLLDEPTSFLDPKHSREIMLLLRHIHKDRGVAIIVVTHDINGAALSGGRVVALKDGTVVFSGESCDFMNQDTLEGIFDTTFEFTNHPITGDRLIVPAVAP
jgi:iron complex transport system ATP-binding protein